MQLTFTSFGSIIVFSLCFSAFLAIALKYNQVLSRVKYELFVFCLMAPIMRLLIPVEILPWTKNIDVPYVLPDVMVLLNKALFHIGTNEVTIWGLVSTVLLIISFMNLARVFLSYVLFVTEQNRAEKVEDPAVYQLIDKILAEKNKKLDVSVRWTEEFKSPSIFGIVKPTVLMPKQKLDEKDLENVLRHEIAHYLYGDLVVRFIWAMIKAFCWWNPTVYLLDNQLEKLLEIRADENALKGKDEDFQNDYMETIIAVAKTPANSRKAKIAIVRKGIDFHTSFQEDKGLSPQKRIELILGRSDRKALEILGVNILMCFIVIVLTVAMNCLIFEPKGAVPEVETYTREQAVTADNSFFIKNPDGTYDMYFSGVYCTTLDSTRGTDLPIYESLEEALENENAK